jgi:molybdenum cofactor sulfurtransferase
MSSPCLAPSSEPFQPSLLALAKAFGYTTLLDAAALAPSSILDLTETPVDAVAISFYKMFGYPTGVGALILAPGVAEFLLSRRGSGAGGRPWFAGGTVDVVQVPGHIVTRTSNTEEAFEVRAFWWSMQKY